ncbi:MAG: polyphosphate polymerase domain-containing protein, partial [Clostridia bacterium]|nr:polyphosphate polymerase domain-containing protein [Clostridia bacterium]
MAGSVFERVEKKYIISSSQYDSLMQTIPELCVPDIYPESDICSVYYDTPDHLLIRRSLDKPVYKEKLRIRSYDVPTGDSPVFVELKKKLLGTVYKRRISLKYSDAMEFLNSGGKCKKDLSQIEKEIAYCFDLYRSLQPAMFVSYHRKSFVGINDYGLRITFDNDVLSRTTDLELAKGIWGDEVLAEGHYIMEIKTLNSMPLRLAEALDKNRIFPGSFSKYGTAYQRLTEQIIKNKGA